MDYKIWGLVHPPKGTKGNNFQKIRNFYGLQNLGISASPPKVQKVRNFK
uniref:Uncharacterized protein n=1 Tax=Arundo donax TaxID=35708 RepID=A0A0A9LK35_ARUDO